MTIQDIPTEDFPLNPNEILALRQENKSLRQEAESLRQKTNELQEQLNWFMRQIFGKRSERVVGQKSDIGYLPGFEPSQEEEVKKEKQTVASHERQKPNRNGKDAITLPEGLPVERQIIDIPEEEKICKETGKALVKIGEEVTRKLAHRPGAYFLKEIVRPKYAVPQHPDAGIIIADLPESLLSRCQADESFLAETLVKKFGDHLPLYRQSEMLSREDIFISRQQLSSWVIRAGLALKPLQEAMLQCILDGENVFVDETPINILAPGTGKTKQGYMWVIVGGSGKDPPYRIYNFFDNRKHINAKELLSGYDRFLHSDKYGAYETLAKEKAIIWCPCWAHMRRKFYEAETGDPLFRQWILRKIRYLFMLERVAWARNPEERLRIRQEKEVPIIDEIVKEVRSRLVQGKILPKSKLREALGYVCGLIPYLKNYTQDPFARIDNNVAERAIRPLAIGRKNWLFFGNDEGGEAASVIFSLVQTCRALGINPREYLEDVMRRLMSHSAAKIQELFPDRWAAERAAKASPQ